MSAPDLEEDGFSKKYKWEIMLSLIITLVALLCFALGYKTGQDGSRTPIIIEKVSE